MSDVEKFISFYESFGIKLESSKYSKKILNTDTNNFLDECIILDIVNNLGRAPLMKVRKDGFIVLIFFDKQGILINDDIFG